MIDLAEVRRQKGRPPFVRQRQQGEQIANPICARLLVVERQPGAGALAADRRLGSGPEHRSAAASLPLRRYPDWLAAPPAWIARGRRRTGEAFRKRQLVDDVVHDAVMIGIKTGNDRVVVRKGK